MNILESIHAALNRRDVCELFTIKENLHGLLISEEERNAWFVIIDQLMETLDDA